MGLSFSNKREVSKNASLKRKKNLTVKRIKPQVKPQDKDIPQPTKQLTRQLLTEPITINTDEGAILLTPVPQADETKPTLVEVSFEGKATTKDGVASSYFQTLDEFADSGWRTFSWWNGDFEADLRHIMKTHTVPID